jgi:hypothetical protein
MYNASTHRGEPHHGAAWGWGLRQYKNKTASGYHLSQQNPDNSARHARWHTAEFLFG